MEWFFCLLIKISMAGNMYDFGLPSYHLFQTFKIDCLLHDLEVFISCFQNLDEPQVFDVGLQLIPSWTEQFIGLKLLVPNFVHQRFRIEIYQVRYLFCVGSWRWRSLLGHTNHHLLHCFTLIWLERSIFWNIINLPTEFLVNSLLKTLIIKILIFLLI